MKHTHEWELIESHVTELSDGFAAATLIYACPCGDTCAMTGRTV